MANKMNTSQIYSDLGEKLKGIWTEEKIISPTQKAANQYLSPYANLRYFVGNDGKFLYKRDDKGKVIANEKGEAKLDYEEIYTKNSALKQNDKNGEFSEAETKKYIDNLFEKTNESFMKLKFLSDYSNFSRFNNSFGSGKANSHHPEITMDLRAYDNIAQLHIKEELKTHFNNTMTLLKNDKVAPATYNSITKKISNNEHYELSFLDACKAKINDLGDKDFDIVDTLTKKILEVLAAHNDINQAEANHSSVKNKVAPDLAIKALNLGVNPEDFKKTSLANALPAWAKTHGISVNAIKKDSRFSPYFTKKMYADLDELDKKKKK